MEITRLLSTIASLETTHKQNSAVYVDLSNAPCCLLQLLDSHSLATIITPQLMNVANIQPGYSTHARCTAPYHVFITLPNRGYVTLKASQTPLARITLNYIIYPNIQSGSHLPPHPLICHPMFWKLFCPPQIHKKQWIWINPCQTQSFWVPSMVRKRANVLGRMFFFVQINFLLTLTSCPQSCYLLIFLFLQNQVKIYLSPKPRQKTCFAKVLPNRLYLLLPTVIHKYQAGFIFILFNFILFYLIFLIIYFSYHLFHFFYHFFNSFVLFFSLFSSSSSHLSCFQIAG